MKLLLKNRLKSERTRKGAATNPAGIFSCGIFSWDSVFHKVNDLCAAAMRLPPCLCSLPCMRSLPRMRLSPRLCSLPCMRSPPRCVCRRASVRSRACVRCRVWIFRLAFVCSRAAFVAALAFSAAHAFAAAHAFTAVLAFALVHSCAAAL